MPEQLKHRIYEFEVTPPVTSWEKIAARISDDEQYAIVTAKMNDYYTSPPPAAWDNIVGSLEKQQSGNRVLSISRKVYRFGAAAILAGLLIGAWLLVNKNNTNVNIAVKKIIHPIPAISDQDKKNVAGSPEQQSNTVESAKKDQSALVSGKIDRYTLSHQNEKTEEHLLRYAIVNTVSSYNEHPLTISSSPILDKSGNIIRDLDILTTNNNYVVVAGPNGQLTRISSKFANVIRYLNGADDETEEYLDKVIKESSIWKKRFQEWRTKIGQSAFIPSSVNFLDIIELKELVEEKE